MRHKGDRLLSHMVIEIYGLKVNYLQNLDRDYLQRSAGDGWANRFDAPADQTHPSDRTCSSSMGLL